MQNCTSEMTLKQWVRGRCTAQEKCYGLSECGGRVCMQNCTSKMTMRNGSEVISCTAQITMGQWKRVQELQPFFSGLTDRKRERERGRERERETQQCMNSYDLPHSLQDSLLLLMLEAGFPLHKGRCDAAWISICVTKIRLFHSSERFNKHHSATECQSA